MSKSLEGILAARFSSRLIRVQAPAFLALSAPLGRIEPQQEQDIEVLPVSSSERYVLNRELLSGNQIEAAEATNWNIVALEQDEGGFDLEGEDIEYYKIVSDTESYYAYSRSYDIISTLPTNIKKNKGVFDTAVPIIDSTETRIINGAKLYKAQGITAMTEFGMMDMNGDYTIVGMDNEEREFTRKKRIVRAFIATEVTEQEDAQVFLLPDQFRDNNTPTYVRDINEEPIATYGLCFYAGQAHGIHLDISQVLESMADNMYFQELAMQVSGDGWGLSPLVGNIQYVPRSNLSRSDAVYVGGSKFITTPRGREIVNTIITKARERNLSPPPAYTVHENGHFNDNIQYDEIPKPAKPIGYSSMPEAVASFAPYLWDVVSNSEDTFQIVVHSLFYTNSESAVYEDKGYSLSNALLYLLHKYNLQDIDPMDFMKTYQRSRMEIAVFNEPFDPNDPAQVMQFMAGKTEAGLTFQEEHKEYLKTIVGNTLKDMPYTIAPHVKNQQDQAVENMQSQSNTHLIKRIPHSEASAVPQSWCWHVLENIHEGDSLVLTLYDATATETKAVSATVEDPFDTININAKSTQLQSFPELKVYVDIGAGEPLLIEPTEATVDLSAFVSQARANSVEKMRILVLNDGAYWQETDNSNAIMANFNRESVLYLPAIHNKS